MAEDDKNNQIPDKVNHDQGVQEPTTEEEHSKGVPDKITNTVKAEFMGMVRNFSPSLMDKFGPEQISESIKMMDKSDEREFKSNESTRRYGFTVFLTVILLIVFFTFFLANDNKDLLISLLTILFSLGAGFAGGYGYGKSRK